MLGFVCLILDNDNQLETFARNNKQVKKAKILLLFVLKLVNS